MSNPRAVHRFQRIWMVEVRSKRAKHWQATGPKYHSRRTDAIAAMRGAEKMWSPRLQYRVTRYEASR